MSHQNTAVDGNDGAGNVAARARTQEHREPGDVRGGPGAAERDLVQQRLARRVVAQHEVRHLRREQPRRDRIDQDPAGRELARHHPRQLMDRRLARGIGIGLHDLGGLGVYRPDVDDPRRILVAGGCREQRQEPLRERKRRLDVDRHDAAPALGGEVGERCAPGLTGVVDERVKSGLARRELAYDGRDTLGRREVGVDTDGLAVGTEGGNRLGERVLLAPRDVDPGARGHEGRGQHPADAADAAGDEHRLARDRIEPAEIDPAHDRAPRDRADAGTRVN